MLFRNFDLIIIDGASRDNTLTIVENLSSTKTLIISEEDDGIFFAMNKGINLASGRYFCFLNAGDTYDAELFQKVSDSLENDPDSDILCVDSRVIDVNQKIQIGRAHV